MSAGMSDDVSVADRPNTKMQAINAVRARFSRYYFNEELCGEAIVKLALYHRKFDPKRKTYLEHPVHDWTSHCADAMTTEALTADVNENSMVTHLRTYITEFNPLDDSNL